MRMAKTCWQVAAIGRLLHVIRVSGVLCRQRVSGGWHPFLCLTEGRDARAQLRTSGAVLKHQSKVWLSDGQPSFSFPPPSLVGGEASLWDISINSSTQGPILEQLQLQHKVSSVPDRLGKGGHGESLLVGTPTHPSNWCFSQLQERRGAELRAKRDEDERKRRQEEQKRREEEELFRRKQARGRAARPPSSKGGGGTVAAMVWCPQCSWHFLHRPRGTCHNCPRVLSTTTAGGEGQRQGKWVCFFPSHSLMPLVCSSFPCPAAIFLLLEPAGHECRHLLHAEQL